MLLYVMPEVDHVARVQKPTARAGQAPPDRRMLAAAMIYSTSIRGIEDDDNDFTRFLLLRSEPVSVPPGVKCKTSVVFSLENMAGTGDGERGSRPIGFVLCLSKVEVHNQLRLHTTLTSSAAPRNRRFKARAGSSSMAATWFRGASSHLAWLWAIQTRPPTVLA